MTERTATIASSHGLHARPASLFTQAVAKSGVKVHLAKGDGKAVNAASILGIISLGIESGDTVTLSAEGENSETVLDDLAAMLERDLDAE
ncbi:HPr family phosphocarrier protein [Subtercola sp. Z020]|uniref:HPr family phosphocarrier protein n=1 Tax=Subtercola sp. Z020 TaxID=2080582 RepID=UPI000CE92628|nr:HPr family phosphocarrier protein [Subtercola sp. Z020]PPF88745.1 HPr family phosphocarrier protein [Subtercola sp. Z020]